MDAFSTFGIFGFVCALVALSRVQKLERILRENGIRPSGAGVGRQLQGMVGQTLLLSMSDGTSTPCKVLEADEEWVHVIRNEGKKNQRELLLRLCDVKSVKEIPPAKT